jgi:hypothetical protein
MEGGASLAFEAPQSKSLVSGVLSPTKDAGEFSLAAKTAGGQDVHYAGRAGDDGSLVLTADIIPDDAPARVALYEWHRPLSPFKMGPLLRLGIAHTA